MNKEKLLSRTNEKLQQLLETSLYFALLITQGEEQKFETYSRVMLNKYDVLKKANIADFSMEEEEDA